MNFVQTMKDWKRMCNAMGQEDEYDACEKCGLGMFGCPAIYEKECDDADWDRVEKVVVAWAAEHPEPVYPTWGEWLIAMGILYRDDPRYSYSISIKANAQIPADIAQKLGIKPKEG